MYHHWSNDDPQMDRWAELSQRPILNSERQLNAQIYPLRAALLPK
jgi:hypothetical protein